MPSWLVAMLPVLGVMVGAALQHAFSRSHEAQKQREGLRTTAYVDYLRGVTMTALAQRCGDGVSEAAGNALMADAKARMCVYGGSRTLGALASFSKLGAVLSTRDGIEAFVQLCQTMRAETGDVSISRDDMARVLFDHSLSDFPVEAERSLGRTSPHAPGKGEAVPAPSPETKS